jgi:uncharacterized sulfatase
LLARWPGKVPAGAVSGEAGYLGDMMATFAEVAGVNAPDKLQSVSLWPALAGRGHLPKREYLYWEFYEGGVSQALLIDGHWKAIRGKNVTQLFDLSGDPGENKNIAAHQPAVMARAAELFKTAHVDNEHWKIAGSASAAPKN